MVGSVVGRAGGGAVRWFHTGAGLCQPASGKLHLGKGNVKSRLGERSDDNGNSNLRGVCGKFEAGALMADGTHERARTSGWRHPTLVPARSGCVEGSRSRFDLCTWLKIMLVDLLAANGVALIPAERRARRIGTGSIWPRLVIISAITAFLRKLPSLVSWLGQRPVCHKTGILQAAPDL